MGIGFSQNKQARHRACSGVERVSPIGIIRSTVRCTRMSMFECPGAQCANVLSLEAHIARAEAWKT